MYGIKSIILLGFLLYTMTQFSGCAIHKVKRPIFRDKNMPVKQLDCIKKFVDLDVEKLKVLDTNLLDIRVTCKNIYDSK